MRCSTSVRIIISDYNKHKCSKSKQKELKDTYPISSDTQPVAGNEWTVSEQLSLHRLEWSFWTRNISKEDNIFEVQCIWFVAEDFRKASFSGLQHNTFPDLKQKQNPYILCRFMSSAIEIYVFDKVLFLDLLLVEFMYLVFTCMP